MKWSYDLTGAEPIVKDMPVYDSASISNGELLILGTTAFTAGGNAGFGLISAALTTVMTAHGLAAVGISLSNRTTNGAANATPPSLGIPTLQNPEGTFPSVAAALNVTTGLFATAKVIVNPFAVYRAEVTTADALPIASSSGTTMFTVTGVPVSSFNGAYIYFCASAGPNFGSIRRCISSATAGTLLMDKAVTNTITTADAVILLSEVNQNPYALSTGSAGTSRAITIGQTTVASTGATKLRVVDNLIEQNGFQQLRQRVHGQQDFTNAQAKRTKFHQEIMMLNRMFQ